MGKNNCRQGAILIDARHLSPYQSLSIPAPSHGSKINHYLKWLKGGCLYRKANGMPVVGP